MNAFEKAVENYLGKENLEKIQAVCVGIAGAGGIGSNCAMNLVRTGFKKLVIADFDRVEMSNLNRQFFFLDQLGAYKVDALKENLLKINPDIKIKSHVIRIDESNIGGLFQECGVLVEAFDNPACKAMILEYGARENKFLTMASGIGGYGSSDEICVRRLGGSAIVGDGRTSVDEVHPPLSPRVNLTAAKQADELLAHVLQR